MSENPLLDIISAIKDLSESDEYESSDPLPNPPRSWCIRKTEVDSIGYAGTNTNDSGYKSFCPTPDVAEYDDFDQRKQKEQAKECASTEQILKLRQALECALSRYKPRVCDQTNYLKPGACCCTAPCRKCPKQVKSVVSDCCVDQKRYPRKGKKVLEDPTSKHCDLDSVASISQQLDLILYRIPPEPSRSSVASTASSQSSQAFFRNQEAGPSTVETTVPSNIRSKVKCIKTDPTVDNSDYHLYEEIIYELMTSNSKSEPDEPPPLPERPKGMKNPKHKKKNRFLNFIQRGKQQTSNGSQDDDYGFCSVGKK